MFYFRSRVPSISGMFHGKESFVSLAFAERIFPFCCVQNHLILSIMCWMLSLPQVQPQSPKTPHLLSPEDGVSAAVESYNPRGSASFIEQRQPAKECTCHFAEFFSIISSTPLIDHVCVAVYIFHEGKQSLAVTFWLPVKTNTFYGLLEKKRYLNSLREQFVLLGRVLASSLVCFL